MGDIVALRQYRAWCPAGVVDKPAIACSAIDDFCARLSSLPPTPPGWWCLRQHSEEFDKQTGQYIKALRLAGAKPIDLVTVLDWSEKRGTAAP